MKWMLLSLGVLLLAACGQTKTQDYYMNHPGEIPVDLAECQKLGKNTFNCNEAAKAAYMLRKQP